MTETILKMIPLWLLKSLIPLVLVSILQYYICKNKPKYSLVVPALAFLYFIGKCFLFYVAGANLLEKEYMFAIYLLVFLANGCYFTVTLVEYFYFKHHREKAVAKMPFSR